MGYGMATNIRKRMHRSGTLFIYDAARAACERFKSEWGGHGSIHIVDSPVAGVNQSNTLVTTVPAGADVREVFLEGPGAVIGASKGDRVILECSTIDVQTAREVGAQITAAGIGRYVDSPVSVSLSGTFWKLNMSFNIGMFRAVHQAQRTGYSPFCWGILKPPMTISWHIASRKPCS